MNGLYAVCYVSSARSGLFSSAELDALLVGAREFNARCGVTGVLLHQGGNFLQYFEGPTEGVKLVYERILRSHSHTGLIELLNQPISQRHFQTWAMGFAEPTQSELQRMSQAAWLDVLEDTQDKRKSDIGLHLLLDFWLRAKNPVPNV